MTTSPETRRASEPRSLRRRWSTASAAAALLLVVASAVIAPSAAIADGPTTFTNTSSIAIPATGSANQTGPADPYPSAITVSGMTGVVTAVKVVFNNLTHLTLNDIDAMVVAPSGENLVVLSDVGDPNTLSFSNNATLTFDDAAAGSVPTGNVPTGTYRVTNGGSGDAFPAPAPAPSAQTTLAGAFTGIAPNGTWQLFAFDDATGDLGQMAGGWSLIITTEAAAAATTTTVTSSGSPSTTGSAVTFAATVTAGAIPVTVGSVAFTADGAALGTVAVNASGVAQVSTSALSEGTHAIVATYTGSTGFLTSNGSLSQRVDNATVVTGNTFCNTGPLTVPAVGTAAPYPSNITVSGLAGPVTKVTAALKGLAHEVPVDLDIMLSGPTPTTNLLLMSDVGGTSPVSGVTLVFDDAAGAGVPTPLASGTFRPSDDDADAADAAFPAPAPVASSATTLATFAGTNGNGQWSLWVVDDATGDSGSIAGGWCLTVLSASPTMTTVVSSLNPSAFGDSVTITATVTSSGVPVSTGTVSFDDGGTALGAPVPLAADGTASLTTSALASGTHTITATYSGTAAFVTSSGVVSQVVDALPIADAGGPYSVTEGGDLMLDGSGSTPGVTYEWDLNGDGDYADATGVTPTLTWTQLESLGIDDGPATHTVALRVTLGAHQVTGTAQLDVANTPPITVVTGSLVATAGTPFTIKVGADDPSSADMAAIFTYTVDWGDGSPLLTVNGPADLPVTHTYTSAGTFTATLSATDKDGGSSEPIGIEVLVDPATPTPPPTPTTPASGGTPLPATGADPAPAVLVGGLLLLAGFALVARARRRRS